MKELKLEVKKLPRRETKEPIFTCTGHWCGAFVNGCMEETGCSMEGGECC